MTAPPAAKATDVPGQYKESMGPKAPIEAQALVKKAASAPKPAQKAYVKEVVKRYPQAKGPDGKSWIAGIMSAAGLSAGVAASLLVLL